MFLPSNTRGGLPVCCSMSPEGYELKTILIGALLQFFCEIKDAKLLPEWKNTLPQDASSSCN